MHTVMAVREIFYTKKMVSTFNDYANHLADANILFNNSDFEECPYHAMTAMNLSSKALPICGIRSKALNHIFFCEQMAKQ